MGCTVYAQLAAPNDRNGNPRRCFAVWLVDEHGAELLDVIDEGYGGDRTAHEYPGAQSLGRIDVGTTEYHAFLRQKPKTVGCDGAGPHVGGHRRRLPTGGSDGGAMILCRACHGAELLYRDERNQELPAGAEPFALPAWAHLAIVR